MLAAILFSIIHLPGYCLKTESLKRACRYSKNPGAASKC